MFLPQNVHGPENPFLCVAGSGGGWFASCGRIRFTCFCSAQSGRLTVAGLFNAVPERVRAICFLPSFPVWLVPHVRGTYADYLDWWYLDPNAADRETGWE